MINKYDFSNLNDLLDHFCVVNVVGTPEICAALKAQYSDVTISSSHDVVKVMRESIVNANTADYLKRFCEPCVLILSVDEENLKESFQLEMSRILAIREYNQKKTIFVSRNKLTDYIENPNLKMYMSVYLKINKP